MTDDQVIIIVMTCVVFYIICLLYHYSSIEQRRIETSISELPTSNPVNRDCTIAQ